MNEHETYVTILVKYDIFPFYLVNRGTMRDDGSVKTDIGYFAANSILKILPYRLYEEQQNKLDSIRSTYRSVHENLMQTLLDENDVNFQKKN